MRFRELPRALRVYLVLQPVVLAPVLYLVSRYPLPNDTPLTVALLLASVTFSLWKLRVILLDSSMSPTFAIECLALLTQGVPTAVGCAIVSALIGSLVISGEGTWRLKRLYWPLHQCLFNVGNAALACGIGALAFDATHRVLLPGPVQFLAGLAAFTVMDFVVNTGGVSIAIALSKNLSPLAVWRENYQWTLPGYLASASAAAGIRAAYASMGVLSLLLLPPLYFIYYGYQLYTERFRLVHEKHEQDMAHVQELNRFHRAIISSLAAAIDAKDRYTSSHIDRVHHYACALSKAAGLSEAEQSAVATAALVHDIGKVGVPDQILGKPGKLTADEYRQMQAHVNLGADILEPVPFSGPVIDLVRTHHERWDGLGYPHRLKGEEIPVGGRILAVVDVFDALTSHRPYRRGMSFEDAANIIRQGAGTQFDPRLAGLFLEVLPDALRELEELAAAKGSETPLLSLEMAPPVEPEVELDAAKVRAALAALSTGPEGTPRALVDAALALLPADTVIYFALGADGGLTAEVTAGKDSDRFAGMRIEAGEGAAGWVAESGQPLRNTSAAVDLGRRYRPQENVELSSGTLVPVRTGAGRGGVLGVYSQAYSVLTEAHLSALQELALAAEETELVRAVPSV